MRHFCDWLLCCNEGRPCPRRLSLRSALQWEAVMVRRRGRLREGLDAVEPVTRPLRGAPARGSASQLLSSIEAVGAIADSGWSCPAPRWRGPSQLRRGRSGEPGGKEWDLGRRAECAWRASTERCEVEGCWVVEKEGRRERSERWRDATFIPRESGARPVHAPCPMRRSRFPDAGLPSGRLLYKLRKLFT